MSGRFQACGLENNCQVWGVLYLTSGGDALPNKRIDWNIEKSHTNDAVCITDLQPDTCDIKRMGNKTYAQTKQKLKPTMF